MKLLTRLEKKIEVWALLAIGFIFFLLRLPSLFEPYWYGDEGIYQAVGDSMRTGRLLYAEIWDNKPPLLYVIYAILGSDQFAIRLFSLLIGLVTIVLFYFLAKKLFSSEKIILTITALFAFLYGIPYLEGNIANAENFMLPFLILGGSIVYTVVADLGKKKSPERASATINPVQNRSLTLFSAGLLIGIAFLFKTVAIFEFAAFLIFLFIMNLYDKKRFFLPFSFLNKAKYFLAGFLFPFSLSIIYFLFQGTLSEYIYGILFTNVGYVNVRNEFFIPQGFLLIKTLLLSGALYFLYTKRTKFSAPELFIFLWFVFSLFNAFFSHRPYTHYLLFLLPSYLLVLGIIFDNALYKKIYIGILLVITIIILNYFNFFPAKKSILYYGNFYQFVTGQKDMQSYQSFFDRDTPAVYNIAFYLKSHLSPNDPVFIWGDAAQIYHLSKTLPIGRYTVAYHISGRNHAIRETNSAIERVKPRYIVVFPNYRPTQIDLSLYAYKLTIDRINIYERLY